MGSLISLGRGGFAVGPRPRGGDWLESDLLALRDLGFTMVVSLLTEDETMELHLRDEKAACADLGLQYWSYPIADMTVPVDRGAFDRFVGQVFQRICTEGGQAYCHCRAGLGRAPLLGCSLLVRGGMAVSEGWALLSARRGQGVPETRQQRDWVQASPLRGLDDALDQARSQSGNLAP